MFKLNVPSLIITAVFLFANFSCAVNKIPTVMDGDKAAGTLTFIYEYSAMQQPKVNWDSAHNTAYERCLSWGYKGAKFFDSGVRDCAYNGGYGCERWRVIRKCQCTD